MKTLLKRYAPFLAAAALFAAFLLAFPGHRDKAFGSILFQAKTMLLVIPPIFLLLGLLDVWVPRERMIKLMGEGAGLRGTILAFLLGSFAAGPLYGAFPFAAVLVRKGASLANVFVFVGAWSTTKLPMLLFEASALGARFALSRLAVDLVGIALIAGILSAALPEAERAKIRAAAAEEGK